MGEALRFVSREDVVQQHGGDAKRLEEKDKDSPRELHLDSLDVDFELDRIEREQQQHAVNDLEGTSSRVWDAQTQALRKKVLKYLKLNDRAGSTGPSGSAFSTARRHSSKGSAGSG